MRICSTLHVINKTLFHRVQYNSIRLTSSINLNSVILWCLFVVFGWLFLNWNIFGVQLTLNSFYYSTDVDEMRQLQLALFYLMLIYHFQTGNSFIHSIYFFTTILLLTLKFVLVVLPKFERERNENTWKQSMSMKLYDNWNRLMKAQKRGHEIISLCFT